MCTARNVFFALLMGVTKFLLLLCLTHRCSTEEITEETSLAQRIADGFLQLDTEAESALGGALVCMCMHTHTFKCTNICRCTAATPFSVSVCAHTHTHTHTYTHTHTHTHTCIHTYMHTHIKKNESGCTATMVLQQGEGLLVASIGDTRAILGGIGGRCHRLTVDHSPAFPEERARIEAAGGTVSHKILCNQSHCN
jgi:hypothetical protein